MRLKVDVWSKDTGFKVLNHFVGDLAKQAPELRVGIFDDMPAANGRLSLASLLAINEFGTRDGHVPERPAVQTTFYREEDKYAGLMGQAITDALAGTRSLDTSMRRIGEVVAADIKKTIAWMVPPDNAPNTIRKKGFNHPLVETATMSRAITYQVRRQNGGGGLVNWLRKTWTRLFK